MLNDVMKELRTDAHLTQKELCEQFEQKYKITVAQSTISKIESGDQQLLDPEILIAYSKYFHKSADFLLGISTDERINRKSLAVSEETGLSQIACEKLSEYKKLDSLQNQPVSVLSQILELQRDDDLNEPDMCLLLLSALGNYINREYNYLAYIKDNNEIQDLHPDRVVLLNEQGNYQGIMIDRTLVDTISIRQIEEVLNRIRDKVEADK